MTDPILKLQNLSVGYEAHAVLENITLTLERGTFTGLLGSNGSGKSTLIRTILGIQPALAGEIVWGAAGTQAPSLGYVPQRDSLDSVFLLSSFEVVLMGACGRIGPGRFINRAERDWARQCLQEAGAAEFSRRRFSELSGGQRQRVLIARALATRPDLLLLDEPTAGIDAAATQAVMELLKHLHQEHHLTILMVNHDLPAVRKTVQQVIWLHQGRILFGPVAELLSREKIEEIMDLELH
jgi:ABC-type Mn2+/Zn2+ transport system ATPase subunit